MSNSNFKYFVRSFKYISLPKAEFLVRYAYLRHRVSSCSASAVNKHSSSDVQQILGRPWQPLQVHPSPKPDGSGEQQWTLPGLCNAIAMASRGERINVNGCARSPASTTPKQGRQDPNGSRPNAVAIAGRAVCPTPVRLERCAPPDPGALPPEGPSWTLRAPDTPVWTWTVAECHSVDVCTATIEMPPDGYLILKSSCRGLTFRDVSFRGEHTCPVRMPHSPSYQRIPLYIMSSFTARFGCFSQVPC